jgi:hypothetical protein
MRAFLFLGTFIAGVAPACASEAFIPQIGNNAAFGVLRETVAAARIASPIRMAPPAAPTRDPVSANSNFSSITQVGTKNLAVVTQVGGSNLSAIVQHGSGNQVVVNQRR